LNYTRASESFYCGVANDRCAGF